MKQNIIKLLIIAIVFTYTGLYGQHELFVTSNYTLGEKYEGYVILNAGDTIKGYIKARKLHRNQNRVHFYTENHSIAKLIKIYSPDEIKEYGFKNFKYHVIDDLRGFIFKRKHFLLFKEGTGIKKYTYFNYNDSIYKLNDNNFDSNNLLKEAFPSVVYFYNDHLHTVQNENGLFYKFKKKMPQLTSDYGELSYKIRKRKKGYKYWGIYDIIEEYNAWYGQKKTK